MTPTYLNPPRHFGREEFRAHMEQIAHKGWSPLFPTLHNTGVPSLKQWLAMGATAQERWGANLNRYYQGMGWHAGPHLVVCPDYIWLLCDPMLSGVSVSCWNSRTFGIEMVGNYEVGADDFTSGEGAKVRDNAVAALAILSRTFHWTDLGDFRLGERGLHFHRECAQDHHSCPGSRVSKPDILARVRAYPLIPDPRPTVSPPALARLEHQPQAVAEEVERTFAPVALQTALNQLGAAPRLIVDGVIGPATIAAVRAFQSSHELVVDGQVGPLTSASLHHALRAMGS